MTDQQRVSGMAGRQPNEGRVEDFRLIRGEGRFSDDIHRAGQLYAAFVRSPHAHARILSIDVAAARSAPGVVDVLTVEDLEAAGVTDMSGHLPIEGRGGKKIVVPKRPPLARGRAMHVGDPVAMVVAESRAMAEDAAERVAVRYEELASVTGTELALEPGQPQLWPDAPGNVALDWPGPAPSAENEAEVDRIVAAALHRVRVKAKNQRLAGAPLEPRGATAEFDPASGRYTLYCGTQGTLPLRAPLAAVMRVDQKAIRIITDDVGGGFGLKTPVYPEYPPLMVAAKRLGRPVHWMSTRSESFVSDNHGRDVVATGELALDADGRFLALKVDAIANMGGYLSSNGAQIATGNFSRCFPTVYRIPKIAIGMRCVFTNTTPTGPYRGAGRPEANFLMERLVDAAARATGFDPIELRRRNLAPPDAMPYATPVGTKIDSGEFEAILDEALELARYASFEERRKASAAAGKLRGVGVSCFLEHAGGLPIDSVDISFAGPKRITFSLAAQSTGQGHATVFRDVLARQLQIAPDAIAVRQGDSDLELPGFPTVASRSATTVSATTVKAVEALVAKGRKIASSVLEAAEDDIAYANGAFEVAGTDRRIGFFALAEIAAERKAAGEIAESLDTRITADTPQTFPNGCHIAEVEIDPDTGHVRLAGYVAVDDCGTVLNHMLVEGQVAGSLAQGFGQALMEQVVYDRETGQLVTGTFSDYAMPVADQMPPLVAAEHPVPCKTNPLGVKGVGEVGTTAAIAAVMNAIADAIPGGRGADIEMPATPEKLWRACNA
ncbi:MAG: xanthine dehydrogenase family protein molybdopterin-binding subunit [Propylenella sp.]